MTAVVAVLAALASGVGHQPLETAAPPDSILTRPITLALRNTTLTDALAHLRHSLGVPLAYSGDALPPDHRITIAVRDHPLGQTLEMLLEGTGLGVLVTRDGTVVVVPRRQKESPVERAIAPSHDVRLATGVRQLDQVVVIGTPVAAAPEREQPTAMTVVGRTTLSASSHRRTSDLVRTLLPGVVLWDYGPAGPPARVTAIRGVSSFTTRTLKTYVDGVELASPDLFTLVDGRSIERMEVIRGPQGAALYGPDALNGVLHIVTRQGQPGDRVLRPRGSLSAGPHQRAGMTQPVMWQDHSIGLAAASSRFSVDAGGALARAGSDGTAPWLRSWSASVGTRAILGPVILSGSARSGRYEFAEQRAYAAGSVVRQELEEQGIGVTTLHRISDRWQHTVVAGYHSSRGPREQALPAILVPSLPLGATHEKASRLSIRYSSAWDLMIGPNQATLSTGVEHARRHVERLLRPTAVANRVDLLYDDDLNSTGAFGQVRLRVFERLVTTAGARAEWLSSVGEHRTGPTWASAAGLSWAQPVGHAALRIRAAWGRGIRPPEPGMRRSMATSTVRQLANPHLAPEVQSGIEVGLDLFVSDRLWTRATWYQQRAEDLIQQVAVRSPQLPALRSYQFQNVGIIDNRGVELESGARQGPMTLTATIYLNRSRVTRTAPGYGGELGTGDALPEVPASAGNASLRYQEGPIRAELGTTWLGSWTGYDWKALADAERGVATVRELAREYWIKYPTAWRPYLTLTVSLGRSLQAALRVDNLANRATMIRDNRFPPLGRTAVLGLELVP